MGTQVALTRGMMTHIERKEVIAILKGISATLLLVDNEMRMETPKEFEVSKNISEARESLNIALVDLMIILKKEEE